jgi:hypothetical protein
MWKASMDMLDVFRAHLNSFYLSFTMLERVILGNFRYTVERFTGKFGFILSPTHELQAR